MICLVVILIDDILADDESSTDGKREPRGVSIGGKNVVDVVHGWDDSCKIWSSLREKEGHILKSLQEKSLAINLIKYKKEYLQNILKFGDMPFFGG